MFQPIMVPWLGTGSPIINLSVQELGIGYIYLVLNTFQRAINQFQFFYYHITIESLQFPPKRTITFLKISTIKF
jgi:hypothetical protein